jgi:general secretion pathway protein E/type IV pilus assembly protein PilB
VTSTDEFVVQLALEKSLVRPEDVDAANARIAAHADADSAAPSVIDVLVEARHLSRATVLMLLSHELSMAVVDLEQQRPSSEAVAALPRELAIRYRTCPVRIEGGTLWTAIADPLNSDATDSLAHVLGLRIEPLLASLEGIQAAIARHYGRDTEIVEKLFSELAGGDARDDAVQVVDRDVAASSINEVDGEADAPIVRLVHKVILEAIQRRASDIHLEPLEKRFRLRYRIDGVLLEVENPPKRLQLAVISRLKLMANMSIAEKRIPQDGRIQIDVAGKSIDLRVSCLPSVHGESIVMRILDKEALTLGLPELGFLSDDQGQLEQLISLPDGIFLVTGPTGSGKTTTLYACLHFINKPDRKIITVEDPVEYQLAGINQVPVRMDIGMTFAAALRSMLRQAPNIIMVGEIRDLETAEIAINASLTGHMVFSTLHTNDAPSAVTRLIDIGVKPFLVATSMRATMAQRLVRRVCRRCAAPDSPTSAELRALNIGSAAAAGAKFMRGKGCPDCNGTGYRGRLGIFEIFNISEEIQKMIYDNVQASKLRENARLTGMRTMREDGIRKVLAGMTTIDEVASATVGDVI